MSGGAARRSSRSGRCWRRSRGSRLRPAEEMTRDRARAASRRPARARRRHRRRPAAPEDTTAAAAPAAEGSATSDGAALNDEGFALLQSGDYEGAIPVLQQAVAALEGSRRRAHLQLRAVQPRPGAEPGRAARGGDPDPRAAPRVPGPAGGGPGGARLGLRGRRGSPDGDSDGGPGNNGKGNAFGHDKGGGEDGDEGAETGLGRPAGAEPQATLRPDGDRHQVRT